MASEDVRGAMEGDGGEEGGGGGVEIEGEFDFECDMSVCVLSVMPSSSVHLYLPR